MDKDYIKLFEPLPQGEYLEIRENYNKSVWISSIKELENYKIDESKELFIQQHTKGNKKDRKGENSKSIKHLFFDIDNTKNLDLVLQNIKSVGLPIPTLINNSGGGFHVYYELKERTYKDITPLLKAIALKINSDLKVTDKARILRLESSINNKPKYKKPLVEVVYKSSETYDLSLFERLTETKVKATTKSDIQATTSINFNDVSMIYFEKECNNEIFKTGVIQGYRNQALGRIIKALEMQNIKPEQAYNHVLSWNGRNKPPLPENELKTYFKAYWGKEYKLNGCMLNTDPLETKENIKIFKEFLKPYCNKEKCKYFNKNKYMQFEVAEKVAYKREFIQGPTFKNISGNALILLGLIRFYNGLYQEDLRDKTQSIIRTSRTFKKTIRELLENELIEVYMKKNKKYYEPIKIKDLSKGFKKIHYHTLEKFIKENHSQNVFKTYLLLSSFINENQNTTFISQKKLAKILGTSQPRLSEYIKILVENNFIIHELIPAENTKKDKKTGKFIRVKRSIYKII